MFKKKTIVAVVLTCVLALSAVSVFAATKRVTIRVQGMHCVKCAASITKALKATDGVKTARVSFAKSAAVVTYDDQKVTVAKLREVINNTGFKALEDTATASR